MRHLVPIFPCSQADIPLSCTEGTGVLPGDDGLLMEPAPTQRAARKRLSCASHQTIPTAVPGKSSRTAGPQTATIQPRQLLRWGQRTARPSCAPREATASPAWCSVSRGGCKAPLSPCCCAGGGRAWRPAALQTKESSGRDAALRAGQRQHPSVLHGNGANARSCRS